MNNTKLYLYTVSLLLFMVACKPNSLKKETVSPTVLDSLIQDIDTPTMETDSLYLKGNELKVSPIKQGTDATALVEAYLEDKRFKKETDTYTIDFCYPVLKESLNPKFKVFNEYVAAKVLKLPEIEQNIIESQELICDTLHSNLSKEHRIADYKIFLQNEQDLSVLFYLENHYTNTKATYYTFKTVNFSISEGKLLRFEDFFDLENMEEVLDIVNIEISTAIRNGDMFYECFTVSKEDFEKAKNDFVIKDNTIIYYFNDCVMCPSFVGTYEIEIPLERFIPILKKDSINDLGI